ncbi:hypothetical protein EYZ11_009158 [Aspergillus tanneri]|uniref:DNA-directed RNA polymerase III subunit RPC4 n=1 Tax=Aspergillus tanneri TaxID=1220188 RepID=A0A4S3J8J3_9EURO|nr:uncharacterized protein ATNIH1004_004108 [Aspergillus tanneri]KAA8648225.1 hypothetical protein ATNIH1004_004108 [Aspergillus tanneri]THC91373.1 hypothetical protein EYZ11_009158 [Aspergillus tanneri]
MPPKAAPRRGAAAAATTRQNDAVEGTPASSVSTSTAAARAPVQRLQSLKKRAPSGSIKPTAGVGDGETAKPALKYKPRAVGRRSKEEREAIEKLEAERHRERLAEAAAIQRSQGNTGPGGRGGFGRGRGGPMGSAGPLGSGMAGRRGRGGGRFGNQDSRHSSMSRRSRSVIDVASGAVSRDVSSDESDTEVRISIDQINLDGDEDESNEVVVDKKGKAVVKHVDSHGEKGLRPIRVERHEHEERVVSVNMESSSSKSAELRQQAQAKTTEDNALFVPEDGAASQETESRVKQEPTDGEDQAMEDVAPHQDEAVTTDDGLLPVQKVKVRRNLGSREASTVHETPTPTPAPIPVVKDPKSLLRTKEDVEEYDRHINDLEMIKDLLWREEKEPGAEKSSGPDTIATATDQEKDDAEDEGEDESTKDKLAGQLFLMQFPPMTPNLIVPGEGGEDVDAEAANTSQHAAAENTALNGRGIKREDGVEVLDGADDITTSQRSKIVTASDWQLPAGRVGKLNVHASGRVSMEWGGISFELDRATAVDFLQEALIVSENNEDDVEVPEENKVWAMGQLSGKFTVSPDWGKML